MRQNQIVKILKEHINIEGMAKDIAMRLVTQKIRVVKVKEFPKQRFIDNSNGTITDTHYGLTWVKNPHTDTDLLKKFRDAMKWRDAFDACKALDFTGYKDWRIPTVKELSSIIDYAHGGKDNKSAIDVRIFPDTKCSRYWTGTPCAWDLGCVWGVDFNDGYVYGSINKDNNGYVRPVRSSYNLTIRFKN